MPIGNLNYTANGNIRPSRFVTMVNTGPFLIKEVDSVSDRIVGVMYEATRNPPGTPSEIAFAAIAGDTQFTVYGNMEVCNLLVAENVSAGDPLKSDTQGRGVKVDLASATPQNVGAVALMTAAANTLCRVRVQLSTVPVEVA